MCDSGRQEDYQGLRRIWEIQSGGASYWVAADSASKALERVEEWVGTEEWEWGTGSVTVRVMPARESLAHHYDSRVDIQEAVRDWPLDDENDEDRTIITAYACEWAAAVPDLMISTDW